MMTVAQLIAALSKLNPDAVVAFESVARLALRSAIGDIRALAPGDVVVVERAVLVDVLKAMDHVRMCRECSVTDWTECSLGRDALAALADLEGVLGVAP